MFKSARRPPQIPFSRRFFVNQKGPGTSFQATFFIEFFDKNFTFFDKNFTVILHKLANFCHQTVFTSRVIQQNVFRVSFLGI